MNSKRARHATYNINCHFVWCPKYRRAVLGENVARRLAALNGEVIELTIQPDHVHLFASFPPTTAPYQVMYRLKGCSAHPLRKEFPRLNSRLPNLWTHSYYAGTAGHVSSETSRRYLEAQKGR